MFIATKQEIVLEPLTHSFNAPDTDFHNGSGAAMKWCETTRNMNFRHKVCGANPTGCFRPPKLCANTQNVSFGPKECIEIFQVVCLESYCSEKTTLNQMHADTSFRNRSGASTKWRDSFENMSFGPKVVDWACSLLENKKRF